MVKRILTAAIFCLFLCVNAGAEMVSFYIIETGVQEDGRENQHSVFWESAFLDVFFDAGHIVSNAPILQMENKPSGDILRQVNMHEVKNAGIDFIIIAQLDYNSAVSPAEMSFFVYRINPKEKIFERKVEGRPSRPARDEYEFMKSIARGLITYVRD